MNMKKALISTLLSACAASGYAQNAAGSLRGDVVQQERIEQGLRDGQLTVREAGKIEREESRIDKMQSQALRDGKITPAERARLQAEQNRANALISAEESNGRTANPNSRSARRMQADVMGDIRQEKRVESGLRSGQLSNREAGILQRGQGHTDRKEAEVAHNGHINAGEQVQVKRAEAHQSARIAHEKRDPGA